jgi:hypothetical protein
VLSGGAFAVSENAIRSTDSSFQRIDQFLCKKVFKTPSDFHTQSFNTCIAPLVRQAANGETVMCVIGGSGSFDLNNYLLSQKGMNGFLCDAANLALQHIHKDETSTSKQRSLTFSWFRMDCSEKETLTDICDTHPKELVLRELGNGRGMAAYDLAEVEITNGNEVDVIIRAVLDNIGQASHASGEAHTIMQLKIATRESKKHSAKTGAGKLLDPAGTGRLYFVMLSNLSSIRQLMASDGSVGMYPWAEKVPMIMDWLESKRATPPFKSSRLLLFLRDALYGRQSSTLMLLLNPTVENLQLNYNWLTLCQRLCKDSLYNHHQVTSLLGPALGGISASTTVPGSPSTLDSPHSRSPADTGGFNSVVSIRDASDTVSSTGKNSKPANSRYSRFSGDKKQQPDSSPLLKESNSGGVDVHAIIKGDFAGVTGTPVADEKEQFVDSLNASRAKPQSQPPPPPPRTQHLQQQSTGKQRRDSATYDESNPFFLGVDDSKAAEETKYDSGDSHDADDDKFDMTHLQNSVAIDHTVAPNMVEASNILSQINSELGQRTTYQRRMGTTAKLTIVPGSSSLGVDPLLSSRSTGSDRYGITRPTPLSPSAYTVNTAYTANAGSARYNESEMILAASLDMSRRETDGLRQKLLESNEKLALCQQAYDSLVAQLREEGSLLIKKEQERFKKCLQDLRDYEVYKRVMEAAMIRMQQEVSNLSEENHLLKNSKNSIENVVRKQKSSVFKSSKEVQHGTDRIHELEKLSAKLDQDVRNLRLLHGLESLIML